MSTPSDAGNRGPAAGDRGVPTYDTLFDDPDAPATPVPAAPPAAVPPFAPAAPAAPESESPAAPAAPESESPAAPAPVQAAATPETDDPPIPSAPADPGPDTGPDPFGGLSGVRPARPVDTGRLYRSAGAEGPQAHDAIPALSTGELPAAAGAAAAGLAAASAAPAPEVDSGTPAADPGTASTGNGGWVPVVPLTAIPDDAAAVPSDQELEVPVIVPDLADDRVVPAEPTTDPVKGGLTWTGVAVVMTAVTVALAFAQVLVMPDTSVWWITGVGYVLATVYCALTVRPTDLWAAFVVPPLAWLIGLLTAGQLTLQGGGSLLLREGAMVFVGLSFNAPWIIGAALLALVIILVRRARAKRAGLI